MTPDDRRPDRLAADPAGGLDRAVREDLDRLRLDALLAERDASAELTRAVDESVRGHLAVAEIDGLLDRLEQPVLGELGGLLAGPGAADLRAEGQLLTTLLKDGGDGHAILQRGLVFVRHRRFAEAVEWWSLNRQGLDVGRSRLHLLLLILEALTHSWAGDAARAAAVQGQVRAHPLFRALAGPGG